MNSLWNDEEASAFGSDPLSIRVCTSRLLGREPALVLHGGGNTSVKLRETNIFGESEELLYVKGSGGDLAAIEKAGFAPVKMSVLLKMAGLSGLSDTEMVRLLRTAMTDPGAPNPSVEAVLHAIIPFVFVDHTHADAVVAVTNTERGSDYIRDIYGDRVLTVPYVMPGFILAKKVYEMTRGIDWKRLEGIILMNHGVFTFADDGRTSYERMVRLVTQAEDFFVKRGIAVPGHAPRKGLADISGKFREVFSGLHHLIKPHKKESPQQDPRTTLLELARLRKAVSAKRGLPVLARLKASRQDLEFANDGAVESKATRGPLTPDHVIRTKRTPVILRGNMEEDVERYGAAYEEYFKRNANGSALTCLDRAPRWAVWPGRGTVVFGGTVKETEIISDIIDHTLWAIQAAEGLDRWQALPEKDIFDVEYWELEQAKIKQGGARPVFQGKVAVVTGAASGIGKACALTLHAQGAAVCALDINPGIEHMFTQSGIYGGICDVTNEEEVKRAVESVITRFGGLDILVSNAGIFPAGEAIEDVPPDTWGRSLDVNLSSHQRLLKQCIPFLALGIDPAVVIVASKNVPAPGPGASAYSVAKAGLTQLARVAALELGPRGIRVNVVHPNQVFDTAIWTPDVLASRARQYGMSVEEYKKSNILRTEITSSDVAQMVCAMAGPVFAKTTGAQVPIDGGNDRVI
ncbi:MAG: short-chain dehydrogenase [Omnitrophica WOR_2 bacterium RIFCSPHIGHO2_02_FULL_52_10]|nr:MAG: short-chain dehydrogenase [Omnitrophica WOR_2 bacterium RIFCSPHIGHO2_02_FULL_52_10]